jgi:hypothetical protein
VVEHGGRGEPAPKLPRGHSGEGPQRPPEALRRRGAASVRAFATNRHALYVGLSDDYIAVQGDGDTDLDCRLYNPSGELVASDTRPADVCVLAAPDVGTHTLVVRNLGEVYNDYLIGKQ